MHAWVIRKDRHGAPEQAMQLEVVPTWTIGPDEVLVLVMAAGVNYNGVWAAQGKPISVLDVHQHPFHVAGSDAAGIVWAVGARVRNWKVGDEVVVHCNQVDGDDEECNGGDPMLSPSQRIWGYETPDGAFAQYTRVHQSQLIRKPTHLSWEASACYMLTLATAYRMLFGHQASKLTPGQNVLVWGASGGLGAFAVQLCKLVGANAVGVVSNQQRADYVMALGAKGVINRNEFDCWGQIPDIGTPAYAHWLKEARRFGRAIWNVLGEQTNVDIVFEHPGEATFPVSCLVAKRGGVVVFCGATSGYKLTLDARYVWMHQKRIQGSHFAHMKQAVEANRLVEASLINPCLTETFDWAEIAHAHQRMASNSHPCGNMAVLVGAAARGSGIAVPQSSAEAVAA
jgi:crotonyl-CoA carboxylase/reductase